MKVCIIGDGLVSLTLANVLIQKELEIDILISKKKHQYDKSRTLGITKNNIDYFNKEIVNLKKILWNINRIKIYTEKSSEKEILEFDNDNKQVFSIIKNYKLQKLLNDKLKNTKFIKFKTNVSLQNIIEQKYKLIINTDPNHQISKKFFYNKIEKNYNSFAYTTIINHKKIIDNNTAFQNFTNDGPIAFLPISETQTSVVYSLRTKKKLNIFYLKGLIRKYNPIYSEIKINGFDSFKLRSSNLRKYYKDNILAFGDLLHKIHPLAGQGFNMSLRDIKLLSNLIDDKINLGLDIDNTICHEFQKCSRDKNYLFSTGIDLIYELFNFESKINSNLLSKSISVIGKNKIINSILKKFADNGLRIQNY
jgi:2-octaprenyl-6-methoxyphenol hydroxylase